MVRIKSQYKTYINEMEMQENIVNNILFFSDDEYDISCLKKYY